MTKVQCQDIIDEFFKQEIINDKKEAKRNEKTNSNNHKNNK